jgi:hypothetical protein
MMPLRIPLDFWWTVLQPVCQSHVAVRQIDRVGASRFGSHRVLLCKHQTHDLAKFDVVEEELDVNRVWLVLGCLIGLVIVEVISRDHLDIGIFDVDTTGAAESYCNRAVSCEKGPPYSFPESLISFAQLRSLDADGVLATTETCT